MARGERPLDPPEPRRSRRHCEHGVPWDEDCEACAPDIEIMEGEDDGDEDE